MVVFNRHGSGWSRLVLALALWIGCASSTEAALAWLAVRPNKEQHAAALRAHLKVKDLRGDAVALCDIVEGWLTDCKVIHEEPANAGFGEAVLSLAPLYRAPRLTPPVCEEVFNRALISTSWPQRQVKADWVRRPSPYQIGSAYPKQADRQRVWGEAALRCVAPAGGGVVKDCKLIYEEPTGWGFGEAALSLVPTFGLTGAVRDGQPDDSPVLIPVSFSGPHRCELTRAWRNVRPEP